MTRTVLGLIGLSALFLSVGPATPESDAAGPAVRWIAAHSSNFSRRSSRRIDHVVIHTIEGPESSGINWFQNPRANVSAHYIVSHTGRVTQMVRDQDVAWHAGVSDMNARSIGIENEGYAGRNDWTDIQYRKLAELTRSLCDRYGIPKDRTHIIGHSEVRRGKVDPGRYFDWNRFMRLVRGSAAPTPAPSNPPVSSNTGNVQIVETTASSLRVRSAIWGTVLGSVAQGSRFVVRSSQSGWLQIDFRGGQAWIHGSYARHVSGSAVEITAQSGLNARSGPSTNDAILTVLQTGGRYVVSAQSSGWVQVQIDQRRAWISSRYVRSLSGK